MNAITTSHAAMRFAAARPSRKFWLTTLTTVALVACSWGPVQAQAVVAAVTAGPGAAMLQPGPGASAQQTYLGSLRNYFIKAARYPTGRETSLQRPQGEVTVAFELDRNGGVRQASVVKPSNSMLLDGAALSTVRRGSYAVFPSSLYTGEASHRFTVTLAYARDSQLQAPASRYLAQAAGATKAP